MIGQYQEQQRIREKGFLHERSTVRVLTFLYRCSCGMPASTLEYTISGVDALPHVKDLHMTGKVFDAWVERLSKFGSMLAGDRKPWSNWTYLNVLLLCYYYR